jgi:hypothetical protein
VDLALDPPTLWNISGQFGPNVLGTSRFSSQDLQSKGIKVSDTKQTKPLNLYSSSKRAANSNTHICLSQPLLYAACWLGKNSRDPREPYPDAWRVAHSELSQLASPDLSDAAHLRFGPSSRSRRRQKLAEASSLKFQQIP